MDARRTELSATLDLLGQLYDSVLEPRRFPEVLNRTIDHLEIQGMFFAGFNPMRGPLFQFLEGVAPPWRELLLERFLMPDRNPFARIGFGRAPLELVTTQMVSEAIGDLTQSDFYRELMVPTGLHEYLGTTLVQEADLISPLTLFRSERAPRFSPADHERVRALLPHYQRAAQLLVRFSALQSEQRATGDVLDRLPYAIFLLDATSEITVCNRAAEDLLRRGDGLVSQKGRLGASSAAEGAALRQMIADAALTGTRQGTASGGAISISRSSGQPPLELLVSPCGSGPTLPMGGRPTAAVVFVTNREHSPAPEPALLERLYGLTPAEAQVALAIASGKRPAEVAKALGVSLNTVRTHLYRVLEKTGSARQSDLVRLIAGGPLGLRAGPPAKPGGGPSK